MSIHCAIVDFGMGNLRSIQHKLKRMEIESEITSDGSVIRQAQGIILPGVGHFKAGMQNLKDLDLIGVLNEKIQGEGTPVFGICLGMQLFFRWSEEGGVEGLGWIRGSAEKLNLNTQEQAGFKVPHIGWNTLTIEKQNPLLEGVTRDQRFYFTHSYHVRCDDGSDVLARTHYGIEFVSAVQRNHVFGTQFHPEKSHRKGMDILKNFVQYARAQSSLR